MVISEDPEASEDVSGNQCRESTSKWDASVRHWRFLDHEQEVSSVPLSRERSFSLN